MKFIFFLQFIFLFNQLTYAQSIIHEEDFNDCSSISWTTVSGLADTESFDKWNCTTFNGRTYMEIYDNDGNNDDDWLISPTINLDNSSQEFLSFEYDNNTDINGLTLYYSTDFNGTYTASEINNATWTSINITIFDIDNNTYTSNFSYIRSLDLSNISGSTVYFALNYISPSNGTQGWSIDNIRITADYYENIELGIASGDKCYPLKQELHQLINNHNRIEYTSSDYDVWDSQWVTDRRLNDNSTAYIVYDMYSDNPNGAEAYEFTLGLDRDGGGSAINEGENYNREHTFPRSWWGGGSTSLDTQYTDIHFVVPSDKLLNTNKSNFPLGETSSPTFSSTNGSMVGPSNHVDFSGTIFEPIDEYKGDFARMYLYFNTRYNHEIAGWSSNYDDALSGDSYTGFDPWLLETLICWHESDPVSAKEIDRNNAVFSIQHKRNPFIDHPEYVFYIWGSCSSVGCPTVLPVELTFFEGKMLKKNYSELKWQTLSETNSSHFIIEHSIDGYHFKNIGQTIANNHSTSIHNYSFIHDNANNGKNFYRLKMIDLDGQFEYSEVIVINQIVEDDFIITPTLVRNQIKITTQQINNIDFTIYNLHGQILKSFTIHSEVEILDLNSLPKGQYLIQMKNGENTSTKRFIKI